MRSNYHQLLECTDHEKITDRDKFYLFELKKQNLDLLLSFLLKENETLLKVTKVHPDFDKPLTLGKLACRTQDIKLLELLLELDSEVFKNQLGEVEDRNALSIQMINTINFDVWISLAINTTVFNPHVMVFIFQNFIVMRNSKPALF